MMDHRIRQKIFLMTGLAATTPLRFAITSRRIGEMCIRDRIQPMFGCKAANCCTLA